MTKNNYFESFRTEYTKFQLDETLIKENPFDQFKIWMDDALKFGHGEPNNIVLSTISKDNAPNSRVVLLKDWNEDGFKFFTNYESTKAQEIEINNKVSILFFWPNLERQLKIIGKAVKLSQIDSLNYFNTRPKDSQISTWVSTQYKKINSKDELLEKYNYYKEKFKKSSVPKPDNWGGFNVIPEKFEFWQGGAFRLHDRFIFNLDESTWKKHRLEP